MALIKKNSAITLKVGGMHCQKCVARVKDALESVDGVTGAQVSLENETALVEGAAREEQLLEAVCALGFTAQLA